jgi:hypothetical protein
VKAYSLFYVILTSSDSGLSELDTHLGRRVVYAPHLAHLTENVWTTSHIRVLLLLVGMLRVGGVSWGLRGTVGVRGIACWAGQERGEEIRTEPIERMKGRVC